MERPRIAIPLPTSFDLEYNARSWLQYADAVEQSGGVAVQIPLTHDATELARTIASCQAIVLPGSGADVDPQSYGQAAIDACNPADHARENVDKVLLQDAHTLHKPILGICFGHQSLNVWRGGSLVQDLTVLPVNHAAGRGVAVAHSALVLRDSTIGSLLDQEEATRQDEFLRLPVNSSHHQAIGTPGEGLRVVARCPQDGVVEAVEGETNSGEHEHFVVGVQWHPERSYSISASSRALFDRFVKEAARWKQRVNQTVVDVCTPTV